MISSKRIILFIILSFYHLINTSFLICPSSFLHAANQPMRTLTITTVPADSRSLVSRMWPAFTITPQVVQHLLSRRHRRQRRSLPGQSPHLPQRWFVRQSSPELFFQRSWSSKWNLISVSNHYLISKHDMYGWAGEFGLVFLGEGGRGVCCSGVSRVIIRVGKK